jgi:hypothetical protein
MSKTSNISALGIGYGHLGGAVPGAEKQTKCMNIISRDMIKDNNDSHFEMR